MILPSLFLGMMVPGNMLVFKYIGNFDKASQMDTLAISNDDFLLKYARVADIIRLIANILRKKASNQCPKSQCGSIKLTCNSPNSYGLQILLS